MPSTGFTHPRQVSNQYASALHANSSVTALVVHAVDSDGNYVSPGAGSTQLSIREILTSSGASVMDSTNNAIGVTIRAGSAAGTEYTDGDVDATISGGAILFGNGSNTLRAVNSTLGLPVNVVAGTISVSTVVTVSTGSVQVSPIIPGTAATHLGKAEDTQHASGDVGVMALGVRRTSPTDLSAGGTDGDYEPLQLNANGELYVAVNGGVAVVGTVQVSTGPVAVSSIAGVSRFAANNAADGIVHVGDSTNAAIRVNVVAGSAAGSTITSVSQLLDSSGGSISAGDNVNQAIRVNVVAGAAGGSTLATVRQSTYTELQALAGIRDRDQSTQIAAVLNAAPASTVWGLAVREVAQSTGPFQISSVGGVVAVSTGPFVISSVGGVVNVSTGPTLMRLVDRDQATNTAAILNAAPASTSYGLVTRDLSTGPYVISSIGGVVAISTGPYSISSVSGVVTVSTGPFAVSSVGGVLMSRLQDSSGVGIAGSTGPTAIGVNGLVTREVMPAILSTTVLITSTHSTALYSLISSAAGLKQKVFAYFVGSTHTNPSTLVFMSSNAIDRWHVNFGSGSSGISGANLAVSPPSWLFQADVANALNVRIEGGSSVTSTVIARISIGYFSEA